MSVINNETINGIGILETGEYDNIEINGGAKSRGVIKAKKIIVDGLLNAGDKIQTDEFIINGRTTSKGDIISDKIVVNGMLQIKEQNIKVRELICKGTIQCLGSVFGDDINIDGLCNINIMEARTITLRTNDNKSSNQDISGGVGKIFMELCSVDTCTLDSIECDEIKADNCNINVLKANNIKLTNKCKVDIIYYKGDISIDETCKVGEVIYINEKQSKILEDNQEYEYNTVSEMIMEPIKEFDAEDIKSVGTIEVDIDYNKKIMPLLDITDTISLPNKDLNLEDANHMVRAQYNDIEKILIAYKENRSTLEEAEKALQNFMKLPLVENIKQEILPWEDDNNLRIVAYKGTNILKNTDSNLNNLTVEYIGEGLNVVCMGNLICGEVHGDIRSRGAVTCKDVEGNIRATESVSCRDVSGNIDAGHNITCNDIGGYAEANGDIFCNNVTGKVDKQ